MKWVADRRYHHAHKCNTCSLIWEHDPPTVFEFDTEEEMNEAKHAYNVAHTCPACGLEQIECYGGDRPANALHGGGSPTVFYPPKKRRA
jgi:hypothetical protein